MRWKLADGPALTPEFRFNDVRRWRFDYAHLGTKTAIELEGCIYRKKRIRYIGADNLPHYYPLPSPGRHTTGTGFAADCEKYLVAILQGWTVIRLTQNLITMDWIFPIVQFITRQSYPGAAVPVTATHTRHSLIHNAAPDVKSRKAARV